LKRNETTLQAEEGALYSPAFIRVAKNVALGAGVGGVPSNFFSTLPATFPFGGEGRLALWEDMSNDTDTALLPKAPAQNTFSSDANGNIEFAIIALTPLAAPTNLAETIGHGAEVVSACVGKPVKIGGWNSLKNAPLPLEPFHPAGSVWFCRTGSAVFKEVLKKHGTWLGERRHTAHGLGQILVARWPR